MLELPTKALDAAFERWWARYPRKDGKLKARKAWEKALAIVGGIEELQTALEAYTFDVSDAKFIPHAATWLRGQRWLDAPPMTPEERGPWGIGAWIPQYPGVIVHADAPYEKRWELHGYDLYPLAFEVAMAAKLPDDWRGAWSALASWLEIRPANIAESMDTLIVRAVRMAAAKSRYRAPNHLSYFDSIVRERAASRGAASWN